MTRKKSKYCYEVSACGRWFRGRDCKYKHGGWRWINNSGCVECGRVRSAEMYEARRLGVDLHTASDATWAAILHAPRMGVANAP